MIFRRCYSYLGCMKATTQDIQNLSIDVNEHPSIIYAYKYQKFTTCINLITFSMMVFNDSYIVKEIDPLISYLNFKAEHKVGKYDNLLRNELIDTIRICTCFENIFKAELILKGYMIHNLSGFDSKTAPVLLSTVTGVNDFITNPSTGEQILPALYNKKQEPNENLSLSILLKPTYLSVIEPLLKMSMSDSIVDSTSRSTLIKQTADNVKDMVEETIDNVIKLVKFKVDFRNKLHFYNKMEFQISEDDFFMIRQAKVYISSVSHYINMLEDQRES